MYNLQVDVAGGYKETQKLIDELMNMKIPQYKPSSNHVQLSDTGITLSLLTLKAQYLAS